MERLSFVDYGRWRPEGEMSCLKCRGWEPSGKGEAHDIRLPPLLEGFHVDVAEDFDERLVAGGVVVLVGDEVSVESREFALLLEVIAEVTGLGVVRAAIVVVELPVGRGGQFLEGAKAAVFDGPLQARKAPVGVADDVAVALA